VKKGTTKNRVIEKSSGSLNQSKALSGLELSSEQGKCQKRERKNQRSEVKRGADAPIICSPTYNQGGRRGDRGQGQKNQKGERHQGLTQGK